MSIERRSGPGADEPGASEPHVQIARGGAGAFAPSVLPRPRSPFVQNGLLLVVSALLSLLVIEVGLRLLTRDGKILRTRLVGPEVIDPEGIRADSTRLRALYDPDLGWVSRGDDERGYPSARRPRVATRGEQHYAPKAPAGVLRACVFGESFTRGDGVLASESWPALMETQSGGKVEAPNFGVGGYGLDQAYLCFRRHAAQYHPDIVLVGLTVYAVERTTNVYRPFYSHANRIALLKPRFVCEGESLRAVIGALPDPVIFARGLAGFAQSPLRSYEGYYDPAIYQSSLIDHSRLAWFVRSRLAWHERDDRFLVERILGSESEETAISRLILGRMKTESEALGARFAAVILPSTRTFHKLRDGHVNPWAGFRSSLAEAGIEVWDVHPSLIEQGACDPCFLSDGHLTPEANARVAAAVVEHLRSQVPVAVPPSRAHAAL